MRERLQESTRGQSVELPSARLVYVSWVTQIVYLRYPDPTRILLPPCELFLLVRVLMSVTACRLR